MDHVRKLLVPHPLLPMSQINFSDIVYPLIYFYSYFLYFGLLNSIPELKVLHVHTLLSVYTLAFTSELYTFMCFHVAI